MSLRPTPILVFLVACAAADPGVGELGQAVCGDCEPVRTNAQGVINVEGGNSCVLTSEHGLVCPLAFTNRAGGGVDVTFTLEDNTQSWSLPVAATYNGAPATLTAISATNTWVIATVVTGGRTLSVSGAGLANLLLGFQLGPDQVVLSLDGAGESPRLVSGVYEHQVRARVNGGHWAQLCTDHLGANEPAALYGGAFFDPATGRRTSSPATVMLSCKKGGITTCMQWGYRPWQTAVHELTQQTESLENAHVACIQMKRAAYCGTNSWTKNGTPIAIDDAYAINPVTPAALEAVWTPSGALCIDRTHLRHPELNFSGSCDGAPLPACPGDEPWWWAFGGLVANGLL